jgi:hypothetical protein
MSNDDGFISCPLLEMRIDEGACYDINAVLARWVIKAVLNTIEEEYKVTINITKAGEICPKCIHYPFKHL